jgi:nicotinamide mononucleotide adenylyltransferase
MFDWKAPTVQMLGRWQPWHDGHTALFKKAVKKTGQVCIMVRDVHGTENNPFGLLDVIRNIDAALLKDGYTNGKEYITKREPNIIDISYGRDVGYSITQHDLGEEIHNISATKIRNQMREEGKL